MNILRKAAREYLTMRRNLGFKMHGADKPLLDFITFLQQHGAGYITQQLALTWAQQPSGARPAEWARRLRLVRGFALHRSATDPRTEVPPCGLLPHRPQRARPYLYTQEEINQPVERCTRDDSWGRTTTLDLLLFVRVTERIRLAYR